uniref:Uncharacterized protein n=1 Tax=Arundo donax TaxID=35708 RepID=A0A0A8YT01_ARUDO
MQRRFAGLNLERAKE